MSRTNHKEKELRRGFGKEYWKSRLHPDGETPGRDTKVLTHRLERRRAKQIESLAGECPSQPDTLPIRPKAKNLERYIALIVRYKDYRLFMGESVPERIIELANEAKRGGQKIDYIEITPNLAKHCIDFDFVDLKVVCYMVEREPAMDYCEVVIWVEE